MEYIQLPDLQNTYPNLASYKPVGPTKAILFGDYADKNKIEFKLPSLDKIKKVKGTSFRFILEIKMDDNDKNPVYYTSNIFYKDLKDSIDMGNPYMSKLAILPEYIVRLKVKDFIDLIDKLRPLEKEVEVTVIKNIFLFSDVLGVQTETANIKKLEQELETATKNLDEIAKKNATIKTQSQSVIFKILRPSTTLPKVTTEQRNAQQYVDDLKAQIEKSKKSLTNQAVGTAHINYEELVKYVEWITLPNDYDIESVELGGVQAAEKIGIWQGKYITGSMADSGSLLASASLGSAAAKATTTDSNKNENTNVLTPINPKLGGATGGPINPRTGGIFSVRNQQPTINNTNQQTGGMFGRGNQR